MHAGRSMLLELSHECTHRCIIMKTMAPASQDAVQNANVARIWLQRHTDGVQVEAMADSLCALISNMNVASCCQQAPTTHG